MSTLSQTIALYRKRLLAQEASATRVLDAYYASALQAIQPKLDNLYQQIETKREAGEPVPVSWLYEEQRLTTIKQLITHQIDHFAALSLMQTGQMQRLGMLLSSESAQAMLRATVPAGISWAFGVPSEEALISFIGSLEEGSPLRKLFLSFGKEAANLTEKALIDGLTLGLNPKRIAPLVERALNVPRWRAMMISRNEMLRAYKNAALENYRKNSDVVDKWIWQATLSSSRTCISCIAMHGTEHPLSEDLNGHPVCRCARVPKTKSWDDILGPLGVDTSNIPDTRYKTQSGVDWFSKQDEDFQRKALGDARYEAWQDGKFELQDVVKKNHDPEWGTSVQEKPLKELV